MFRVIFGLATAMTLASCDGSEAASKNVCGSQATKQVLAAALLTSSTHQNLQSEAWKSLNIVVLNQKTDETGQNVSCAASVNVTENAVQRYYGQLSERDAKATKYAELAGGKATKVATIGYVVNLDAKGNPTQLALLDTDDETVRSVRWWLTNVVTGRN